MAGVAHGSILGTPGRMQDRDDLTGICGLKEHRKGFTGRELAQGFRIPNLGKGIDARLDLRGQ